MALTGDTSGIGSPKMTGESDLQYYMRIGLNPNAASSVLANSMTGNTAGNATDNAFRYLANRQRPHAQQGWFGGPMVTENDVLRPRDNQWVGNDGPGLYNWRDMPGATPQNNANYMTTMGAYANGTVAPNTPTPRDIQNTANYRVNYAQNAAQSQTPGGLSSYYSTRPNNGALANTDTRRTAPSTTPPTVTPFNGQNGGGLSSSGGPQYDGSGYLTNPQGSQTMNR